MKAMSPLRRFLTWLRHGDVKPRAAGLACLYALTAVVPLAIGLKIFTFLGYWVYMPWWPNVLDWSTDIPLGCASQLNYSIGST